jgi:HEPN domain-containing protein
MHYSVKELLIEDPIGLKKVKEIREKLENIKLDQLSMSRFFRRRILEIKEKLPPIQEYLASRCKILETVLRTIDSSYLRSILISEISILQGKENNIGRMQRIIVELDLQEEYVQNILNSSSLGSLIPEIQQEVNESLEIGNECKNFMLSKEKLMINQVELFEKLLK